MRMTQIVVIGAGLLGSLVLTGWAATRDEIRVSLDKVPMAAQTALLALVGEAELSELERETDDGVTVFEAAWSANGIKHEAVVLSDGTLLETEETVPLAGAPAGVRAAAAQHFPADVAVVVERKMIVIYEIEAKIDGVAKEIVVHPTGKVLHGSDGDSDDDDSGDDGDDDSDDDDSDDDE